MSSKVNPFMEYAANLSKDMQKNENELKSLVVDNIQAISQNALELNFIRLDALHIVTNHSLNLENLRFISPQAGLSSYLPQTALYYLGYPQVSSEACHYDDFMTFIASSIPDLVNLQIEESTFANYFLKNYKTLKMGLTYLKEFHRLSLHVTADKCLSTALETLEVAANCFKLMPNEDNTIFFFTKEKLFKILDMQVYAPLKKLMEIGKTHRFTSKAVLEEIFGNELINFFAICIRMKQDELNTFCTSLNFLDSADKKDQLFMHLFKYRSFAPMRSFLTLALLRDQSDSETTEQFEIRKSSLPVQTAIKYIQMKINLIKTKINPKELLIKYFKGIKENLQFYKPFQESFNFIQHHYNTPKIKNYEGLPFSVGGSDITELIANIWLQADDLSLVTLATPEGRRILLSSAEFLFLEGTYTRRHLDPVKGIEWAKFFPEIEEFPVIQSAIRELY